MEHNRYIYAIAVVIVAMLATAIGTGAWRSRSHEVVLPVTIEGESLSALTTVHGLLEVQNMIPYPPSLWSNSQQLLYRSSVGDQVAVGFSLDRKDTYEIWGQFTKGQDFAYGQFSLDGEALGEPINFYHPTVLRSDRILLGTMKLSEGSHTFMIKINQIDPQARPVYAGFYALGVDYLEFDPVKK